MADNIETTQFRRSLEESSTFLSELRQKADQIDPPEYRRSFRHNLSNRIGKNREVIGALQSEVSAVRKKKHKKFIFRMLILNAALFGVLYIVFFRSQIRYHQAEELMAEGSYAEAQQIFGDLAANKNYKDSRQRVADCQNLMDGSVYKQAVSSYESGSYAEAMARFQQVPGYKDSAEYIARCREQIVESYGALYTWDFSQSLMEKNGLATEVFGDTAILPVANLTAGKAAYFPGGESLLQAPAQIDLTKDWSVSMLLRCENVHAEESCLATIQMYGAGYVLVTRIMLENGILTCHLFDGEGEEFVVSSMQYKMELHKWTLVTVVKSGRFLALYADRVKRMESLDTSNYEPKEGDNSELQHFMQIGYDVVDRENSSFIGEMSRLWVFPSGLTEEQIGMIADTYLDGVETEEKTADIPVNSIEWNGHHYALFSCCTSVPEAIEYCQKRGGYLAAINTADENAALRSAFGKPVVLGYTTQDGGVSWQLVNGETEAFHGIADDCAYPVEGERYYARFANNKDNPGWYLYHDTSAQTDEAGKPLPQDEFVFLCEWNS